MTYNYPYSNSNMLCLTAVNFVTWFVIILWHLWHRKKLCFNKRLSCKLKCFFTHVNSILLIIILASVILNTMSGKELMKKNESYFWHNHIYFLDVYTVIKRNSVSFSNLYVSIICGTDYVQTVLSFLPHERKYPSYDQCYCFVDSAT